VDNATKRSLKKPDQFVALTETGVHWAGEHRQKTITAAVALVVAVIAIVGGYSLYEHRSTAAATAFGSAMQVYQTPVAAPNQPVPPGTKTFPSAKERAAAANTQFVQVASQYGLTKSGKLANYFAGLTYMEEGQNGPAEEALKKTASSWDSGLSALGKSSLAQLYQQTNRDSQAIDLYNDLAKGSSNTFPPTLAKLQLAELYQSEGKTEDARKIYAQIKDSDKDSKGKPGPASLIASEKLNPKAAPVAPGVEAQ
jgi:predicted negative regulator of RcsB-dependent stress response